MIQLLLSLSYWFSKIVLIAVLFLTSGRIQISVLFTKKKIKNNLLTITDLFHYCLYLGKYLNNLFLNLFWVSWWTKSAPRTLIRFQNKWFMYKSTTAYCTWLLYGFLCWSYSWSSRCVSKYVKTSDNVQCIA